jgi:ABC-type nitrate/sulfonate/bicarbonate transport system permease component
MATKNSTERIRRNLGRLYGTYRPFRWAFKLIPIGILLVIWELAAGRVVSAEVLPPFSVTSEWIIRFAGEPKVHQYLLDTLFRGLAGIVIAVAIAVPLGLAMSRSDVLRRNLDPIISITYPIPKSPLIPLVIFWLGMGNASRITLAVIGSFLPILISSYNGATNVSERLLWVARSMGLSRTEELFKVTFPAALPTIMTGIRIGLIFSFIIVVSSEMIMAQTGLGVLVVNYGQFGEYAKVFAIVFWIAIIVASLDRLYLLFSSYVLRWSDQGVSGV